MRAKTDNIHAFSFSGQYVTVRADRKLKPVKEKSDISPFCILQSGWIIYKL
jgi:hypothetical protein